MAAVDGLRVTGGNLARSQFVILRSVDRGASGPPTSTTRSSSGGLATALLSSTDDGSVGSRTLTDYTISASLTHFWLPRHRDDMDDSRSSALALRTAFASGFSPCVWILVVLTAVWPRMGGACRCDPAVLGTGRTGLGGRVRPDGSDRAYPRLPEFVVARVAGMSDDGARAPGPAALRLPARRRASVRSGSRCPGGTPGDMEIWR